MVLILFGFTLTACPGPGSDELPASHSGDTAPAAGEGCGDVPAVDWDNFGQGFLLEACQGCHATTTADRYGAPEDVSFDTVEQAWLHAEEILNVAATDDPSMPPRGGVEDDDRVRLRWWLECGTPGT